MAERDRPAAKGLFFGDDDLNFNFLVALGGAAYGLADPGALLAVAGGIEEGDAASAANGYQRAALLVFTSTYFLDAAGQGDRFAATWLRQQALWDAGVAMPAARPPGGCASPTRASPSPGTTTGPPEDATAGATPC